MKQLIFLIPLLPLAGALLNGVFGKRIPKYGVGVIACAVMAASFIMSVALFTSIRGGTESRFDAIIFSWISAGDLQVNFSFLVDPLTCVMLLVVTGVGFLIHIYSIGYMGGDEGYPRFMAYMNLFVFFMLILVMASNFVLMFVGWEGVGLCSYLLIGFWYKNNDFNYAARKAFVMNRIGDLGFLLGMFLIYRSFGSFEYQVVFSAATGTVDSATLTAIALLLFVGAAGKSAQLPLHTWLPDAMAGPTPVSALIHAATMVTAGVYMVVRCNVIYTLSSFSGELVACIGVVTALFAGTIGLKQNDIKKVLAYSTVSQLGFMFAAAGLGAYTTAIFHLVTHAFFKALLFLGAGSVIHGMSGEQDLRRMGGLRKYLPVTHLTFLVGTLAISGVPPLAGFFSKDEILAMAWSHSALVFALLALASVITAVYMFRLYWLTFHGAFRGSDQARSHLHESPPSMTWPLLALALLAVVGGLAGLPSVTHAPHFLGRFLDPVTGAMSHTADHVFEYMLLAGSLLVLAAIVAGTWRLYVSRSRIPGDDAKGVEKILARKYYIDELYQATVAEPVQKAARLFQFFESRIIDGFVNSLPGLTNRASTGLRLLQRGNLSWYMMATAAGVLLLFILFMIIN